MLARTDQCWPRVAGLVIALLCCASDGTRASPVQDEARRCLREQKDVLSPSALLKARGFQADELYFTTSSNYKLRITRGRNPLISGRDSKLKTTTKDPVLFVHGLFAGANIFLKNSHGATPKDFSKSINLLNSSLSELTKLLRNEPSARSLPLLALNFGHEVWLLDRRGAPGSRPDESADHNQEEETSNELGQLNSWTYATGDSNERFWNYSLDEQARIDFPEVVEFVLKRTGSEQVALVTHSAGGAIALMSQSLMPERLASKISSQIHWAPAYSVGNNNRQLSIFLRSARVFLERYIGPLPSLLSTTSTALCAQFQAHMPGTSLRERQHTCQSLMGALYAMANRRPHDPPSKGYYPSSSHEVAQLAQMQYCQPRSMHNFDFNPSGSRIATPPYDLSHLQAPPSSMSFYDGSTDERVTPADVELTLKQVRVAHKIHIIRKDFDHGGYFSNENAPALAIIPSMQELETLAQAKC